MSISLSRLILQEVLLIGEDIREITHKPLTTSHPRNKHNQCRVAQTESLTSAHCKNKQKNNNNRKIIFAFVYTVVLFMKNMQARAANKNGKNKSYQA